MCNVLEYPCLQCYPVSLQSRLLATRFFFLTHFWAAGGNLENRDSGVTFSDISVIRTVSTWYCEYLDGWSVTSSSPEVLPSVASPQGGAVAGGRGEAVAGTQHVPLYQT